MQIDTKDIMTTKDAAERLGEKQSDLLAHVKKYPHLAPPRYGRLYLWTTAVVEAIRGHMDRMASGHCVHCSKLWNRPDQEADGARMDNDSARTD